MNYQEFLQEVSKTLVDKLGFDLYYVAPKRLEEEGLWVHWTTGGQGGGNCWGDEANIPVDPQPEEDLKGLDEILERFCPNLSFLGYRKIEKLVEYQDDTQWGYYGNWTCYRKKILRMRPLFDFLKELGYLN